MPTLDYQAALQAGKSPQEIQAFIASQPGTTIINGPDTQPNTPQSQQKPGGITGFIGGMIHPLARAGVSAVQTAEGLPTLLASGLASLLGQKQHAQGILNNYNQQTQQGVNLPGILGGNAKAVQLSSEKGKALSSLLDTAGVGLQVGTDLGAAGMGGITAPAGLSGAGAALARVGIGAGRGAAMGLTSSLGQNIENYKPNNKLNILKNTLIGTGIGGVVGGGAQGISEGANALKSAAGPMGQKIQTSIIKPSAADYKDGFNAANLQKYDLGGTLDQTEQKTQAKLADLTKQLREALGPNDAPIDLNAVAAQTEKDLGIGKATSFGSNTQVSNALDQLKNEVAQVAPDGSLPLSSAQQVKQAAGAKGAWQYNRPEPDAAGIEKVYTKFYQNLKNAIEQNSPGDVQGINEQISDLIPIQNAIIRRMPVAARANILGLGDLISGGVGAFSHPAGAGMFALNQLSKSGRVAGALMGGAKNQVTNQMPSTVRQGIQNISKAQIISALTRGMSQ